jgi:tetratricopeptide (TPR) repeat protein
MAKTRRAHSRSSTERPKRRPSTPAPPERTQRLERREPPPPPPPAPSHLEAVALYERGLEAFQRRAFDAGAATFREILSRYPEEREIHERARLYLKVCERESQSRPAPRTAEESLLSATIAMNSGDYTSALDHLRAVEQQLPESDHAQYMRAVIAAARGDHVEALERIRRAIELNPENRALARHDPDLDALRSDETFRLLVESTAGSSVARRRRTRPAR